MDEMRGRYGTAGQFLDLFTPGLQIATAQNEERAYLGTAPSLQTIEAGYGRQVAVVWLCLQIENLNNFTGVKEKMPVSRQKELAELILTEYPALKASEILLFFHRMKCGHYGRFYGMVDALFITSSLLQFMEQRRTEIPRHRARRQQRMQTERPPAAGRYITREEYLREKRMKEKQRKEAEDEQE